MNKSMLYLAKGKTMLVPGLLLAALLSCTKEDLNAPAENPNLLTPNGSLAAASVPSSSHLIFEENFEGSSAFASYVSLQNATSYAMTQATSPVFAGKKSGRIELRDSDPLDNEGTRSEISFPYQSGNHRWYGWSAYFPSASYQFDNSDEVLTQWHQGGNYSPAVSLRAKQDNFMLYFKPTPTTTERINLGKIPKDQWVNIVFHFKHSSGSDGLLEIYFNGKKVYNRTGSVMYKVGDGGAKEPKWKLGIYKSDWNGSQTTDTKQRIFYMDNVRIGSENATLAEMMAGGTTTTPPTGGDTPPPADNTSSVTVSGLTLVNAGTDKDLSALTTGSSINLSTIGATQFNIRANTGSGAKSVKFEMTGAQSKTYTDNAAPFALYGDNGKGDYSYGNWNPPAKGTYTIKVTPYSGTNASGVAGIPYTVSFIVTENATTPSTGTGGGTSAISSLTLVSAHTEQDLMTITNGATISLSQFSVPKLNIRANTTSPFGSVKFDLSGAETKSVKDGTLPYTLNGDSGNNYGFGSWYPPKTGTFTLKVTPYSGPKATGTAGAPYTISFTFVK